jgi:type IV secretory pathway TraG/TraD family ATPase VirD4
MVTAPRASRLFLALLLSIGPVSAASADTMLLRCDPNQEATTFGVPSDPDAARRALEREQAVCSKHNAVIDQFQSTSTRLRFLYDRAVEAAQAKDWNGVAARLDEATPLMVTVYNEAKANADRPHVPQDPVASSVQGLVWMGSQGLGQRLTQAGLPPASNITDATRTISQALRQRGDGRLATAAYVMMQDFAGATNNTANDLAKSAGLLERIGPQKQIDDQAAAARKEERYPTGISGYVNGMGRRLGDFKALFGWLLFAAVIGSIVAMKTGRRKIAVKAVVMTGVIFVPFWLIHVFLPIFPWWLIDGVGIVAFVALWSYTERYPRWNTQERTSVAPKGILASILGGAGGSPSGPTGPDTHGSARWGSAADMRVHGHLPASGQTEAAAGFALGRAIDAPTGTDDRFRQMGHVVTFAQTGGGKGVGLVIPTLLEYPGSMLVLDIKGENYAVTARTRRAMGHEVYVIDPFGVTGDVSHGFNWLDRIDLESENCLTDAMGLADACVIPGDKENDHWDETAKDFIRGMILYVAGLPADRRHMGEVRRLLTDHAEAFDETLAQMMASDAAFGVVARAANTLSGMADRERGSVLSSARRHTGFLDDPRIVRALSRSDFRLRDLKKKAMTVYVVLPIEKLRAGNARFVRGLVNEALGGIMADATTPRHRAVFLLDEFAQLGRMTAIEDAISLVRGFGLALWLFFQDMDQLKVYPKRGTLLANATNQFFKVGDLETQKYVSESLGKATIEYETQNVGKSGGSNISGSGYGRNSGSSTGASQQFMGRELLTPDEVGRETRAIVLVAGEPPYLLDRLDYRTDPEYRGLADPNPYHAGPRPA